MLFEKYSNSRQVWSSRSFLQIIWGLRSNDSRPLVFVLALFRIHPPSQKSPSRKRVCCPKLRVCRRCEFWTHRVCCLLSAATSMPLPVCFSQPCGGRAAVPETRFSRTSSTLFNWNPTAFCGNKPRPPSSIFSLLKCTSSARSLPQRAPRINI